MTIYDVWASSDTNVYAVYDDRVLHYDGSDWTVTTLETDVEEIGLRGIWGSGENEIFVIGYKSGRGASNAHNFISHYNGSEWTEMSTGDKGFLTGIWGSSDSNILATGTSGIYQYNGDIWSQMNTGYGYEKNYIGVWGHSEKDVFFVGSGSTVLHYNGESWNELYTGIDKNLRRIWGRSLDDIYVIGEFGSAFYYDGSIWQDISVTEEYSLQDVWVSPSGKVFVGVSSWDDDVGEEYGVILNYTCRE
jgi:hypothetical protein